MVRAAAGTSLHDLMVELLPRGLFLPVTPGTRYVTVGGAIACDVHGKSHHVAGSFGEHVVSLDLVTADGETRTIGPDRDPELFWATVGGMGLTGVITRAVLRTIPVETSSMSVTTTRLPDLDAAMAAMRSTDAGFTYSVAWIDTLARGRSLGRSVLSQGEHATRGELTGRAARHPLSPPASPRLAAPPHLPGGLVRPRHGAGLQRGVVPQGAPAPERRDPVDARRSSTRSTASGPGTGCTAPAASCSTSAWSPTTPRRP